MDATRGKDVVRLAPFYFGQTQDRGNGKNLCRSHPKLAPSLVPHGGRFKPKSRISDSNAMNTSSASELEPSPSSALRCWLDESFPLRVS